MEELLASFSGICEKLGYYKSLEPGFQIWFGGLGFGILGLRGFGKSL